MDSRRDVPVAGVAVETGDRLGHGADGGTETKKRIYGSIKNPVVYLTTRKGMR